MKLQDNTISLIQTLYEILRPLTSPTPIYEIVHENYVEVASLDGKAKIPKPNSIEITAFDILVASLFLDDINVLFEGITGVGKSFITESFFRNLFGDESFIIDRSNFNPFVESSILSPFITTTLVEKIPQQRINERTKKIAGMFVEEVNRREVNDLLTLLDKVIILEGERRDLGVFSKKHNILKKVIIIGSQNPGDVNHSTVYENDIAEDNRFLKIPFPNAVYEAGSSQLLVSKNNNVHEKIWQTYREKSSLEGDWTDLYIEATTLSENTFKMTTEQREFLDFMLSYISNDPKDEIKRNTKLIQDCGLEIQFNLREDEFLQKVIDIQTSLRYKIVRRDLNKIVNFSRLVGLVRAIKRKDYTSTLSLEDIASSIGVLLEGRAITIKHNQMFDFVNDSLKSYIELKDKYNAEDGIRENVLDKAIKNFVNQSHNIDIFNSTIDGLIDKYSKNTFVKPAMTVFNSRIVSDLLIFKQFNNEYSEQLKEILQSSDQRVALSDWFQKNMAKFETIYISRLGWLVEDIYI